MSSNDTDYVDVEELAPEDDTIELNRPDRFVPGTINMSAGRAPGPDYFGQETVDVDDHPMNRPGVVSRMDPDDPRARHRDTGERLPVLVNSNMTADPCEGVQGSYTVIEAGHCGRCGYDRIKSTYNTLAGVRNSTCQACGAQSHDGDDWTMPRTNEDRADNIREHREKIGTYRDGDIYEMNGHSIYTITGNHSVEYVPLSDLRSLVETLVSEGVLSKQWALDVVMDSETSDLVDTTKYDGLDRMALAMLLMPEHAVPVRREHEDGTEYETNWNSQLLSDIEDNENKE